MTVRWLAAHAFPSFQSSGLRLLRKVRDDSAYADFSDILVDQMPSRNVCFLSDASHDVLALFRMFDPHVPNRLGELAMHLMATTRVNMDHFIRDLAAGDPFVWGLVIVFGGLTIFGLVQKFRSF